MIEGGGGRPPAELGRLSSPRAAGLGTEINIVRRRAAASASGWESLRNSNQIKSRRRQTRSSPLVDKDPRAGAAAVTRLI